MFFITGALLRVVLVISLKTEFSTAYENLNKEMFGRYGPLMTDLVEVHGRDPHLPAHPPPHPPLARVAVKLYCATLHTFPNATDENAFSISQTFARSPPLFWRERHCRPLVLRFVLMCMASSRKGCTRTHCPQEGRHR